MNVDDAEEYTQALGQVVAGGWRQVALGQRLGVPQALGLTTSEWVEDRLGGYVRLSVPARREAVAELEAEGMSNRAIASVLGVGKDTVARDLTGADAPPEPGEPAPQAEPEEPAGADAPLPEPEPEPEPEPAERLEVLPPDLQERVQAGGLTLVDAELVHTQSQQRVDVWARDIRAALGVLGRMAGYPIPQGISARLSAEEGEQLVAALGALEPWTTKEAAG